MVKNRPRPRGRCVFCGDISRLTKEDAIPNWLRRNFPYPGPFRVLVFDRGSLGPTHPLLRAVTESVCHSCNTTWMSRLENQVKDLVLAVINNAGRLIFDTSTQDVLTRWAFKTSAMLELALEPERGSRYISDHQMSSFFTNEAVPAHTQVWLFRYSPAPARPVMVESLLFGDAIAPAYQITCCFGAFGFRLISFTSQPTDAWFTDLKWGEPFDQAMLKISPTSPEPCVWSPPQMLTEADLETMTTPIAPNPDA